MFKNYFIVALRNLGRQKGYSVINIAGLAIGIACCALIALFVQDELSYDRFHENADRIYRIYSEFFFENDPPLRYVRAASAAGPELTEAFPEVGQFVRFYRSEPTVAYKDRQFDEDRFFFVDSTVFEIFSFPFIKGDATKALTEPYSIVLSKETAEKYFGAENPIGKRLSVNGDYDVTVTGIVQNVPYNSHIKFDFLASFATIATRRADYHRWTWDVCYTYLLLQPGTSASALEAKIPALINKNFPMDSWYKILHLQPLTNIHLRSHYSRELEANGSEASVLIFSTIALLILLIACINFMNLTTARSAGRAVEIGVRKVVGARRSQLVKQFLGEAFLVSLAAFILAIVCVETALPEFNAFTGKALRLFGENKWHLIPGLLGIVTLVGLLAGSYPAIFLSAFKPVETIKGKVQRQSKDLIVRKGLVVVQFVISVVLIIATGIVSYQLDSMREQNLGFDREQVVVISFGNSETARQKRVALKSEILKQATTLSATISSVVPGQRPYLFATQIGKAADDSRNLPVLSVDYDFIETYKVEIVAGRNFSKEITSDATEGFLVNEALVRELGWGSPEEALDRELNISGDTGKVIGVVRDFHFETLQHAISPIIFSMQQDWHDYLAVRIATDDVASTIDWLEKDWRAIDPVRPFDFFFLDEFYDRQYRAEERLQRIFGIFTALAIAIACLGLFGLAAFTAANRTKEIGIRKVLGASVSGIINLLSKDFVKLVLLANVIAWPIAWYAMDRWLQNFAYRIEISWWMFALAGGLALVIALVTVSTQAIKAALTNPVEALRYE